MTKALKKYKGIREATREKKRNLLVVQVFCGEVWGSLKVTVLSQT
jgi:hypothetical protein